MDIPSMLTGAGILLAGLTAGRLAPHGRRRAAERGPRCQCDHAPSFHDNGTGACHAVRGRGWGDSCTCRKYTGPEPLPEFYAPEIAP